MNLDAVETSAERAPAEGEARNQMKAAAEAAMGQFDAEKKVDGATPQEATEAAPPETDATKNESDKPEPDLKAKVVARAREQAARIRAEAEAERQKLAQERAELEKLKSEYEPWKARVAKLKDDPAGFFEEVEHKPGEILDKLILQGSPDPVRDQLKAHLTPVQKELSEAKAALAEMREYMMAVQQREQQQQAQAAVSQFTKLAMDADKHPALATMFEGRENILVEEADFWTDRYKAKTGNWPSLEEVAEFLEAKYAPLVNRQQPDGAKGKASQSNGSSKRTLSNAQASQKATPAKSIHEMTPEEQRAHLKRVAEAAARQYSEGVGKK